MTLEPNPSSNEEPWVANDRVDAVFEAVFANSWLPAIDSDEMGLILAAADAWDAGAGWVRVRVDDDLRDKIADVMAQASDRMMAATGDTDCYFTTLADAVVAVLTSQETE